MSIYAGLGVLYYIIYNSEFWQRDRHQPFEVYKLIDGQYRQQIGEPYWMPEVGLGIGRSQQVIGGIEQEILVWSDESGNVYPLPDAVAGADARGVEGRTTASRTPSGVFAIARDGSR